jgi:mannose-1-phosphate guanylyltransferase
MQLSLQRVKSVAGEVRVITSRNQETLMRKVLKASFKEKPQNIFAELEGRDTAAAVAFAARWVQKDFGDDAILAMLPADHFIKDTRAFRQTLNKAFDLAEETQLLITIGITPTRPATGYGYLQKAESIKGGFRVARFKEKPDEKTALEYLQSGNYLWNAGMFVWSVRAIVKAIQAYAPEVWNLLKNIDPKNNEEIEKIYPTIPKISIDYAVMEKADNVLVVPATFDWDDVGEWPAWARLQAKDEARNASQGNVILHESAQNIVFNSDPKHLVAVFGAQDLMVVHTKNATLVAPKEKAQELKSLVKKLSENPNLKKFVE